MAVRALKQYLFWLNPNWEDENCNLFIPMLPDSSSEFIYTLEESNLLKLEQAFDNVYTYEALKEVMDTGKRLRKMKGGSSVSQDVKVGHSLTISLNDAPLLDQKQDSADNESLKLLQQFKEQAYKQNLAGSDKEDALAKEDAYFD